jgi:hypothetical protein
MIGEAFANYYGQRFFNHCIQFPYPFVLDPPNQVKDYTHIGLQPAENTQIAYAADIRDSTT